MSFANCNKPLTALYTPHYSTTFISDYLSEFHKQLESSTHCKLTISLKKSDSEYLDDLVNSKFTFSFMEKSLYTKLQSKSIKAILKQDTSKNSYHSIIISKKTPEGGNSIKSLINKTIYAPGKLTTAYLYLHNELDKENLLNGVTIIDGLSHDIILSKLLKGQANAAVINTLAFNKLSNSLKSKFTIHSYSEPVTTYMVTHINTPDAIIQSIYQNSKYMKVGPWIEI